MGFFSVFCELLQSLLDAIASSFPEFAGTAVFGALSDLVGSICGGENVA